MNPLAPVFLKSKHLVSIQDLSASEINALLAYASNLKSKRVANQHALLEGKSLAMIFQKPSTRTRVSFEAGMTQLGGHALYLRSDDLQLGRSETVADTARTLSRYVDGIMVRLFKHQDAVELAKHSRAPVINGLTDLEHPCQILADLLTMQEHKSRLSGLKVAYLGDAENNVCHSLMLACAKLGMHLRVACPNGYAPSGDFVKLAQQNAKATGASLRILERPSEAVNNVDVVYTDTWVSMGDEAQKQQRIKDLRAYQVNRELMRCAKPDAIFMHDLPAYRGNEVTADVIDGPRSVVFDEAENRLHAQKAVLVSLLASRS